MPGKPKNVMSVELAIQRELAYRKRVATLSELYGGSMEGLKPLELPSPNPNPCPSKKRPQPEPMTSSPHSQPKPSPTQTPSSSPPRRLPFPSAPTQYQRSSQHHSSILLGSKRKEPSSGVKWCPSTNGTLQNETRKYLFCEICQPSPLQWGLQYEAAFGWSKAQG